MVRRGASRDGVKGQRLFLGLPLPPAAREGIREALRACLGDDPLPGRVEPPEKWHLTLVFLGMVAPEIRDRLAEALRRTPLGSRFALGAGGLGAFPRPDSGRVLWLGCRQGSAELAELQAKVQALTSGLGFPPEARPYSPHLTLARLAPPADLRPLLALPWPGQVTWTVDRVVLFESRGRAAGSAYPELLERFLDDE